MSYYPDINLTYNHLLDCVIYANIPTNDWFGIFSLFTIFVVSFASLKIRYTTKDALPPASLLTAIISYLFAVIGIIGSHVVLYPTILFLVSIFFLFKD